MNIPENNKEFLHWFKERSETIWSQDSKKEYWCHNAKWIGLTDAEIDEVEIKYDLKFSEEHREFLRILHTVDRKEIVEREISEEEPPYDYIETIEEEATFFYNWKSEDKADVEEIKKRLNWPYETIFQDIQGSNKVWLKCWGEKPENVEEQKLVFEEWYEKAPKLMPLYGHRFLVNDFNKKENPVLSVWGSDTIVYGWNLRHYLLNELGYLLNLDREELYEKIFKKEFEKAKTKDISHWKEIIMYWSSGWSSFGLEYPYPNSGANRIVKSEPDEEGNNAKLFNSFD